MPEERKIVLFALSYCGACKKTKKLLDTNKVRYIYSELDTVDSASRDRLLQAMKKYNPRETFPTIVINGGDKVVVGFSEKEIKEALNI